jgi:hypothetical protein
VDIGEVAFLLYVLSRNKEKCVGIQVSVSVSVSVSVCVQVFICSLPEMKKNVLLGPRCVLPRVAVCCSVLQQCVAVWCNVCSVLQCVAVCCRVLPCVAVRCSVLQCVAVCCSVLQCV